MANKNDNKTPVPQQMSAAERQAAQAKGGRAALDAMLGQPFAWPSNMKPGPIFTSNVKVTMGPPESAMRSGSQASPQSNIGKLPGLGEVAQWSIGNINYSEGSRNTNSTINARPPVGGGGGGAAIKSTAAPNLSSSTISGVAGSAGFDTSKMTKDMGAIASQPSSNQTLGPNSRSTFPARRIGAGTR